MPKPVATGSVTLRVPSDIVAELEAIAEATERSRSYIIVRALRTYLLNEGADILAAVRGREQVASGEYEDMADVLADMDHMATIKTFGGKRTT